MSAFMMKAIPSFKMEFTSLTGLSAMRHPMSSHKVEVNVHGRLMSTFFLDRSSYIDRINPRDNAMDFQKMFEFLDWPMSRMYYEDGFYELRKMSQSPLFRTMIEGISKCRLMDFTSFSFYYSDGWSFWMKILDGNGNLSEFKYSNSNIYRTITYIFTRAGQMAPADFKSESFSKEEGVYLIDLFRLSLLAMINEGNIPVNRDIRYIISDLKYKSNLVDYCLNNNLMIFDS